MTRCKIKLQLLTVSQVYWLLNGMNVCEYSGQKWATTANNLQGREGKYEGEGGRDMSVFQAFLCTLFCCTSLFKCSCRNIYTCSYIHIVYACACVYAWCLPNSAQKSNFTRIVSQICIFYLAPHFCLFARLPHIRIPCNHAMQARGSFVNHTDKVANLCRLYMFLIFLDRSLIVIYNAAEYFV